MNPDRTLAWDWHPGTIPENVTVDETAYLETSFSFLLYRSTEPVGVTIGRGSSLFLGTMFDVGPCGHVTIGQCSLINGARIVCDREIEIGDYALISWNVVMMDSYRVSFDPAERRRTLERVPFLSPRIVDCGSAGNPIRIGSNVWIGFDSCILPGITIGDGAVVGARSVVADSVEPYTIVAGNPARVIRRIDEGGHNNGG
jgi:acetyltransferase-like isoleucine patch superfamily enzyme